MEQFYEALADPKTWLFALFSALDNVPNSLANQRQSITASFGFSNLQRCVDGLIELLTISTEVRLVARYKDSRAYVGAIYFVPNILGVLLINFLPWENKVGLLFSQWLTGASIRDIVTLTMVLMWGMMRQALGPRALCSPSRGSRVSPPGTRSG